MSAAVAHGPPGGARVGGGSRSAGRQGARIGPQPPNKRLHLTPGSRALWLGTVSVAPAQVKPSVRCQGHGGQRPPKPHVARTSSAPIPPGGIWSGVASRPPRARRGRWRLGRAQPRGRGRRGSPQATLAWPSACVAHVFRPSGRGGQVVVRHGHGRAVPAHTPEEVEGGPGDAPAAGTVCVLAQACPHRGARDGGRRMGAYPPTCQAVAPWSLAAGGWTGVSCTRP